MSDLLDKALQTRFAITRIEKSKVGAPKSVEKPAGGIRIPKALLDLKERVNNAKTSLDPIFSPSKDKGKKYRVLELSHLTDPYHKDLAEKLSADCAAQYVSNSWLKYYEIYEHFNMAAHIGPKPCVFFNAELPGGSLSAWNHYARTHDIDSSNWYASSYAPKEEKKTNLSHALGDVNGIVEPNRDHWLMRTAEFGDGDATNVENVDAWERKLKPLKPMLYSHDAGMDVSNNYNDQEKTNAMLHLGCAVAGLATLTQGGIFIAKQYTCFEESALSLITILAQLFDEFWLVKPETSRAKNSEMYLVGIGYNGVSPMLLDGLKNALRERVPFSLLPELESYATTVGCIVQFCKEIYDGQIETLKTFVALWKRYGANASSLRELRDAISTGRLAVQQAWLDKHHIAPLAAAHRIAGGKKMAH